jgi:site-specific DNA recombinase
LPVRRRGLAPGRQRYDDGGVPGPALQRLLADIDARRIDMVVVYKIDRLTRALTDFVRLVERFDAAGWLLRVRYPGVQYRDLDGG